MDRRTKYTMKVIEETLLTLLETKDISSITVTEICTIADVNRATFYRYYEDIYDLLKKIQQNFIKEIENSSPMKMLPHYTVYKFTKEILEIFLKNKKLVQILFNTNNNIYFLNDVLEIAYEKCITKWGSSESVNLIELQYDVIFIFNGALGVINYWIKNNFEDNIDDIAIFIERIAVDGAHKYITNR